MILCLQTIMQGSGHIWWIACVRKSTMLWGVSISVTPVNCKGWSSSWQSQCWKFDGWCGKECNPTGSCKQVGSYDTLAQNPIPSSCRQVSRSCNDREINDGSSNGNWKNAKGNAGNSPINAGLFSVSAAASFHVVIFCLNWRLTLQRRSANVWAPRPCPFIHVVACIHEIMGWEQKFSV